MNKKLLLNLMIFAMGPLSVFASASQDSEGEFEEKCPYTIAATEAIKPLNDKALETLAEGQEALQKRLRQLQEKDILDKASKIRGAYGEAIRKGVLSSEDFLSPILLHFKEKFLPIVLEGGVIHTSTSVINLSTLSVDISKRSGNILSIEFNSTDKTIGASTADYIKGFLETYLKGMIGMSLEQISSFKSESASESIEKKSTI